METFVIIFGAYGISIFFACVFSLFFIKESRENTFCISITIYGTIFLILGIILGIFNPIYISSGKNFQQQYRSETMQVIELDQENDIVYIADANGYRWSFGGIEDWHIGDLVSCTMDTKGTKSVLDDEIKDKKYSGYNMR